MLGLTIRSFFIRDANEIHGDSLPDAWEFKATVGF
jgi:hypothetical protein